jgi:hypothetical protein
MRSDLILLAEQVVREWSQKQLITNLDESLPICVSRAPGKSKPRQPWVPGETSRRTGYRQLRRPQLPTWILRPVLCAPIMKFDHLRNNSIQRSR